jgi:hypothetical protein
MSGRSWRTTEGFSPRRRMGHSTSIRDAVTTVHRVTEDDPLLFLLDGGSQNHQPPQIGPGPRKRISRRRAQSPTCERTRPSILFIWDSAPLAEDLESVLLSYGSTPPAPRPIQPLWPSFRMLIRGARKPSSRPDISGAGLRAVNEAESRLGAPVLDCRAFEAVPIGETVRYRIPLVPNARRFKAGHRIRLYLTSDDQGKDKRL